MQFTARPVSDSEAVEAAKRSVLTKLPRPSYLLRYMRAAVRNRKQDVDKSPGVRQQREWLEKDIKGFMTQLEKLEREYERRRREAAERLGVAESKAVAAAEVVEEAEDGGTDRAVGLMDRLISGWSKETQGA